MSSKAQSDVADFIVETTWLWLPLAACLLLMLTAPVPQMAAILTFLIMSSGVVLLVHPPGRKYLFRKHITHFAFPAASAIIAGAWTNAADADSGLILLATLGSAGAAGALSFLVRNTQLDYEDPDVDPNFIRGSRRERVEATQARVNASARSGEECITFGPLRIPFSMITNNIFILGAPGAGKTMLFYLALKSILPFITPGSKKRVLIYDAKTETISRLPGLGYSGQVIITNFTDARCAAWEIGKDFTEPQQIAEATELLFPLPQNGHSQMFFDYAVKDLAQGVWLSWQKRFPGCLTLRGLINSMESEKRLRQVLAWDMDANYTRLELYFGNRDTLQNILATVASKVEPYRAIAGFWDNAPHRFSLTEWRTGSSVMVLGCPSEAKTAADNLNSLLIGRLTQLLINDENSADINTWVFLDELGRAGRLRHLESLLLQGRSKGALCVLGLQSIGSIRATYGRDIAGDLSAGCGNVAVLALADPDSAEWAEQIWARHERWEKGVGHGKTAGPQGTSYTYSENWNITLKPTVLASEFLALRPPSKRTRSALSGFYRVPGVGSSFAAEISIDFLEKEIPDTTARGSGGGASPDYIRAPSHHGVLTRWTKDELSALGFPQSDDAGLGAPAQPEPFAPPPRNRPQRPAPPEPPLSDIGNLFGKGKRR